MLSLPQKTLDKVKRYLLRQQASVEKQIVEIEKEDPMLMEAVAEASESGTDSWQADVHARVVAVKDDLLNLSKRITHALTHLKKGTYGKCEKCGKAIEAERLEAMPTATVCVSCSKKDPKKIFK